MRGKKAKLLRKKLNLKLPIEPDYKVIKEVNRITYFTQADGTKKAVPTKRKVIINASKHQYRQVKKMFKGVING